MSSPASFYPQSPFRQFFAKRNLQSEIERESFINRSRLPLSKRSLTVQTALCDKSFLRNLESWIKFEGEKEPETCPINGRVFTHYFTPANRRNQNRNQYLGELAAGNLSNKLRQWLLSRSWNETMLKELPSYDEKSFVQGLIYQALVNKDYELLQSLPQKWAGEIRDSIQTKIFISPDSPSSPDSGMSVSEETP